MELSAVATSGDQAVSLFRQHRPDVTLMDLQLPGLSGLEAITLICKDEPSAKIIVLTMFQGEEDIIRALKAGAATYVLKGVKSEDLLKTIRQVYSGQRPIPEPVASLLAEHIGQPLLTPREVEILKLIARGFRNKEIAGTLHLSEETIKTHVKNILAKLKVSDRTAAVNVALKRGAIHLDR